tara:strand:+ start:727 stop:1440 length:714 start_codon:yes stop_codon:yes gene_type:complete
MAEGKKSFVLYSDQRGIFEKITDEQAGVLIKHIFAYVNDENPVGDFVTELAFESIMRQLKRDLNKWSETREGRSKAGKASAESRRNKREQGATNPTSVKSVQQKATNPTVNVNVNDTVNVTDIKEVDSTTAKAVDYDNLLIFINKTFGRSFQTINTAVRSKYKARIKEGYTSEDIKAAINTCKKDPYHIENNYKYCTPEFFSRADKLDLHSSIGTPEKSSDPMVDYVKQHIAKYGNS